MYGSVNARYYLFPIQKYNLFKQLEDGWLFLKIGDNTSILLPINIGALTESSMGFKQ